MLQNFSNSFMCATRCKRLKIAALDFHMGSVSKVTFSLFCFGWFQGRRHPSGCELMQLAGLCKATWDSGQLPPAHPHFKSWGDCSGPLCAGSCINHSVPHFMSELCLLPRAGLSSAVSVFATPSPCRYSFAFFQSGSYFCSFLLYL